ncbi:MAG TPA: GAF domain-containing protein, partial [Xanthobacteraceae bacterium]
MSGKPLKRRGRKTATPKRRNAPKLVRRSGSSAAAAQNKQVARLRRERDEALAHQKATGEILSAISSSTTDTKPVFDAIVRNLLRLFGASTALVAVLRDGTIHVGALGGEPGFERMAERYPLPLDDSSVPGRAMSSKHVIHLAPMIGNPETPVSSVLFARDFGFNSLISAPMLRGDEVIGAIIAARGSSKPFHPKQIE